MRERVAWEPHLFGFPSSPLETLFLLIFINMTRLFKIIPNLFIYSYRSFFLFLFLIFELVSACPIQGQAFSKNENHKFGEHQVKENLSSEDYKSWTSLYPNQISPNGKWYSYLIWYGNLKYYGDTSNSSDTLFVGGTKKNKTYGFSRGRHDKFSANGRWFACLVQDKGLALLDLKNDSVQWIPKITSFEFSHDGRHVVALQKLSDTLKTKTGLLLMNLSDKISEFIPDVTEFSLRPKSNDVVFVIQTELKKEVRLRNLTIDSKAKTIVGNNDFPYKKLVWNNPGTALVFLQEYGKEEHHNKRNLLYHFTSYGNNYKLSSLDLLNHPSNFLDMKIKKYYKLIPSDDSNYVSFKVSSLSSIQEEENKVQVWSTSDKQIYPKRELDRKYGQGKYKPKLAGWWPSQNKAMLLSTDSLPEAFLTPDRKHLLSYNPGGDGSFNVVDIYLTNLVTGQRHLFLKQHKLGNQRIRFSPNGNFIAYFKKGQWWVYNLKNKTHSNVTLKLNFALHQLDNDHSGVPTPYGVPGWTDDDQYLIVYDQYDIWLVSPFGRTPQKLTNGRETKICYRIEKNSYESTYSSEFNGIKINLSENLIFSTLGADKKSGYALWKPGNKVEYLVYKEMHVDRLLKASNKEAFIFEEQDFDISPRLKYWEKGMEQPKLLLETNKQQKKYFWGTSKLIEYNEQDGGKLQGVLFYPANYSSDKKYPMIVHIYELQSKSLHYYKNPSEHLQGGWNHTNYTLDGYFVFYPDIKYKFNDPGKSAVKCVEAGVKAILKRGIVDEKRIGLIGHSFGGYETSFIITQSKLFSAAVAGAAVTDLTSFYHSVGWDMGLDQAWRFESHQWRFQDSYYDNPSAYYRNSPLHNAQNITTPLLIWTGNKDFWLHWEQNIELYLSLRRQNKECELLVYPDEGHTISNNIKFQLDLTHRVKNWFDKHLKEKQTE